MTPQDRELFTMIFCSTNILRFANPDGTFRDLTTEQMAKLLTRQFPGFKQNNTRIAGFGNSTQAAISEHNLILDITAPEPGIPSMVAALEDYVSRTNKPVN